ncbi:MAG TPA: hypothetical protein VMF67_13935 [Rhizomicrobium sp.]|nr:hypothetical protein [Rhizomicrobium sp.]
MAPRTLSNAGDPAYDPNRIREIGKAKMANREQRSNKEKKKPKSDKNKAKPTTSTSPFAEQRGTKPTPSGKK